MSNFTTFQALSLRLLASTPFSIVLASVAVGCVLLHQYQMHSNWLVLLLTLIVLTACSALFKSCGPIAREVSDWREHVKHKSLLHSRYKLQWQTCRDADDLMVSAVRTLCQRGYKSRLISEKTRVLVAARTGAWNRVGFLLSHFAVLIICIAGLFNSGFFSPTANVLFDRSIQNSSSQGLLYKNTVQKSLELPEGAGVLAFNIWPLQRTVLADGDLLSEDGRFAYSSHAVGEEAQVEYSDFRLLENANLPPIDGRQSGTGQAVTFWQRVFGEKQIEYITFKEPVNKDGFQMFLSGRRQVTQDGYDFFYLPVDNLVSIDRFVSLLNKLQSTETVVAYAREVVDWQRQLTKNDPRLQMATGMGDLLNLFLQQGFAGVNRDIQAKVPALQQDSVRALTQRLLQTVMLYAYQDVLLEEGKEVLNDFDEKWLKHAVNALAGLRQYGSPMYLQLKSTSPAPLRAPDATQSIALVSLGVGVAVFLLGLAMQFYLRQRRLWVSLCLETQQLIFAGYELAEKTSFAKEFEAIASELREQTESNVSRLYSDEELADMILV